jgi:cation transport regulator
MPYASLAELPDPVRNALPVHAQEIYQSAYNNAWDEYAKPGERRDPSDSREETAHKVAWAAVKQTFEKRDGRWTKKA